MSKRLQAEALKGFEPEVGRWLWAMESVRRRTLDSVQGLDQWTLDWEGETGQENSIGSMLYHIALVEMSWLYEDVLLQAMPSSVVADFSHSMGSYGRMSRVMRVSPEEHVERLNRSRNLFLEAFREMTLENWERLRTPEGVDYEVTPAWTVFHLVEHEAGHTAQIRAVRRRAERLHR